MDQFLNENFNESDVYVDNDNINDNDKSIIYQDNDMILNNNLENRINKLEDLMVKNTIILEKIFNFLSPKIKNEPLSFVPFFIDKTYNSKDNYCLLNDDNNIEFCIGIITNYDDIPLIYPFAEVDHTKLPAFKNKSLILIFKNNENNIGELDGYLRKNKGKYVIKLNDNYADIIQYFPAKITFNGTFDI